MIGGLEYPVCPSTLISQASCIAPEVTMAAVEWTPQSLCLGNRRKILDLKQNPPFAVLTPQFSSCPCRSHSPPGRCWHTRAGAEGEQAGLCQVAQMCGANPQGWDLGALCPPGAPQMDGHGLLLQQGALKVFLLTSFIWEPCQPINLQIFVSLAGGTSSGQFCCGFPGYFSEVGSL